MLKSFAEMNVYEDEVTGEWVWIQKHRQKKFIKALLESDVDSLTDFLTNMFKCEATYGYLSPSFADTITNTSSVKSGILCDIDTCFEFSDIESLEQLATKFGCPYGLIVNNGVVLPDTPRHFYYSCNISRLLGKDITNPIVVEIGGGYGGLCLHNWKRFNGNCTLVNIDLSPALVVSTYYLIKNNVPINFISNENPQLQHML